MKQRLSAPRRLAIALLATAFALVALPGLAAAKDVNRDKIPDRWERKHDLSLKHNQAKRDQDHDDLNNRGEYRSHTDPRDDDSDEDGVEDGDEGAGTIESYDEATGELVIAAFNGDLISGVVTDETEIECENDDDVEPDEDGAELDEDEQVTDQRATHGRRNPGSGEEDNSDNDCDDEDADDEDLDDEDVDDQDADGEEDDGCSAADLTPGAGVDEAELELTADGLVYEEIELR